MVAEESGCLCPCQQVAPKRLRNSWDLPLGRLERSMSSTMSIDCSISRTHSPPSGHTGRTSIAILCHDESNSLCPSSRLAMPAFPLHGRSFRNGVRFSVHTTSRGSVPCSRCRLDVVASEWSPSSWNDMTGRVVRVASMKFREAQKKPDNALVSVSHLRSALKPLGISPCLHLQSMVGV